MIELLQDLGARSVIFAINVYNVSDDDSSSSGSAKTYKYLLANCTICIMGANMFDFSIMVRLEGVSNDSTIIKQYESFVGVDTYVSRYYQTDDGAIEFELKADIDDLDSDEA